MFVFDLSALMTPQKEAILDSLSSLEYPIDISHLNFNTLCLLLLLGGYKPKEHPADAHVEEYAGQYDAGPPPPPVLVQEVLGQRRE